MSELGFTTKTDDEIKIQKERKKLSKSTRGCAITNIILAFVLMFFFFGTIAFTPFVVPLGGYGLYVYKATDVVAAALVIISAYIFINPPSTDHVDTWQRYIMYIAIMFSFGNILSSAAALLKMGMTIHACIYQGYPASTTQTQFWINSDSTSFCTGSNYTVIWFLMIWNVVAFIIGLTIAILVVALAGKLDPTLELLFKSEWDKLVRKGASEDEKVNIQKKMIQHRIDTKILDYDASEIFNHQKIDTNYQSKRSY